MRIFANSITPHGHVCARVCSLLIKSRANVGAHTKARQQRGNLSICRHGMTIKSHPSDRYWQEQIGFGKQSQLGCARARLCVRVYVYICERVRLANATVLERRAETGELEKAPSCQRRKGDGELSLAQRMQSGHGSLAISRGEPHA